MGHIVNIRSKEQYMAALEVLDHVEGWWHSVGPSSAPRLLLTEKQFQALVVAGVVTENGEENISAKKTTRKKAKS